jgi:hypothetical protein
LLGKIAAAVAQLFLSVAIDRDCID